VGRGDSQAQLVAKAAGLKLEGGVDWVLVAWPEILHSSTPERATPARCEDPGPLRMTPILKEEHQ